MPTMQERREAYRKQKAEFVAQEAATIETIKTGVMERLRERFPGIKFAWATLDEAPHELRVYVRLDGKEYGACLPLREALISRDETRSIHWFVGALSGRIEKAKAPA